MMTSLEQPSGWERKENANSIARFTVPGVMDIDVGLADEMLN